jgi:hypothetical protein
VHSILTTLFGNCSAFPGSKLYHESNFSMDGMMRFGFFCDSIAYVGIDAALWPNYIRGWLIPFSRIFLCHDLCGDIMEETGNRQSDKENIHMLEYFSKCPILLYIFQNATLWLLLKTCIDERKTVTVLHL